MWCCGSGSQNVHPVPFPVSGNLTQPFFLVSTREEGKVTLHAVPTDYNFFTIPVVCAVEDKFLDDCLSGRKPGLYKITHWNETGSFTQNVKEYDDYFEEMIEYSMAEMGV